MIFILANVFVEISFILMRDTDTYALSNSEWHNPAYINDKDIFVSYYAHVLHKQPKNCIIYNLEGDPQLWVDEFYLYNLRKAIKVYDFSIRNIEKFKELGINAEWKPILWHPKYENSQIIPYKNRKNDIIFLGKVNTRRNLVLNRLAGYEEMIGKELPFNLMLIQNTFDPAELKKIRSEYRICLNINQIACGATCAARIVPMVSNRVRVISERSSDYKLDSFYNDIVDWIPDDVLYNTDELVEYLQSILITTTDELLEERYQNLRQKGTFSPLQEI